MKRLLITGGTAFVSRYTAAWFALQGYQVDVLNRGTRRQENGVRLIRADRHAIGDQLRHTHYDAVLDVTAYTARDVSDLLNALGSFDAYLLISSSAVYPDTAPQPFREDGPVGANRVWGQYGLDKLEAERMLLQRVPHAIILRPPYLYGPMQNVYREPFVFECAKAGRPFYLPGDGSMPLQFFHVSDLCRVMRSLVEEGSEHRVLNVGNEETVTVRQFVQSCYRAAGVPCRMVEVMADVPQRSYFCFHDYAYRLDVTKQKAILPATVALEDGLAESFAWYLAHPDDANRRDYIGFIDRELAISR
ncbi:MAG: NAD-dependent epimerase/dehydratase family protein [bacterium]|nr:NAD-dependent epimerase/dehydratase family protein [bacterium]